MAFSTDDYSKWARCEKTSHPHCAQTRKNNFTLKTAKMHGPLFGLYISAGGCKVGVFFSSEKHPKISGLLPTGCDKIIGRVFRNVWVGVWTAFLGENVENVEKGKNQKKQAWTALSFSPTDKRWHPHSETHWHHDKRPWVKKYMLSVWCRPHGRANTHRLVKRKTILITS